MTETNDVYKIRPKARIIHTIGSELIGDSYAALVELVKNSYDADASYVNISFKFKEIQSEEVLVISVEDDGHGMTFEAVINQWLVPATNDKLIRKLSPKNKRILQGRKGIGRFASSVLGQEMLMSTVDENGQETSAFIDWRMFNSDQFLESVELLIERKKVSGKHGTKLEIIARDERFGFSEKYENKDFESIKNLKKNVEEDYFDLKKSSWDSASIEILIQELRKLKSPFKDFEQDNFEITLDFINCPFEEFDGETVSVENYPIIDLYDYRIYGRVNEKGHAKLIYENNVDPNAKQVEEIESRLKIAATEGYCGSFEIDFRVFDRESDAIDNLINKGLTDPISGEFQGKLKARQLLNEAYGINMLRGPFRVRPYGNGGIDWLELDKNRIQNFTLKISNNQIVGFVKIGSSENSTGLKEKSARDGLKENRSYFGLQSMCLDALNELETRRLAYRVASKKSRPGSSLEGQISELFAFDKLSESIETSLRGYGAKDESITAIKKILKEEEAEKSKLILGIQETIAIYQGQASLGKIVNIILHEGRRSIQYFRTIPKILDFQLDSLLEKLNKEIAEDIKISFKGASKNANSLTELFDKISPLSRLRRQNRKKFSMLDVILSATETFSFSLKDANIDLKTSCAADIEVYGWAEDLYTAMVNLIENSLYWVSLSENIAGLIEINVKKLQNTIVINYKDNGPGLTDREIESGIIFEPGYSKKTGGTGLGLAIAGEAIERLGGKLVARRPELGCHFQMEFVLNE